MKRRWLKSITLRAFPPSESLDRCLEVAKDAGFDAVEVNLEPGLPYTLESANSRIRSLGALIARHGLKVSAVYSREQWRFPITSDDQEIAAQGKRIIHRLVECAKLLGTDAVLIVPGGVDTSLFAPDTEIVPYDVAYTRASSAIAALAAELSSAGYCSFLCIENVWNKFLLSPLEARRFVDEINHPLVGFYFDVGNVLCYGFPDQWIRILGSRIKRVHFKDFRSSIGTIHGFVGLLEGDVDWLAVVKALDAINYQSYITAEVLPINKYGGFHTVYECAAALDTIMALC